MDAMEKIELFGIILSAVAIVVSIVTAVCVFMQSRAQNARNHERIHTQEHALNTFIHEQEHELNARSINLASLASLDMELGKSNHDFLKFHSISQEALDEHGVKKEELAYLIASFHLGSIYYSTVEKNSKAKLFDKEDAYRHNMFDSELTRNAWPLVEKFLNDSSYKERCKNTRQAFMDGTLGSR